MLHRAFDEAVSIPNQWRILYNLPLNDPKFTDTEYDVMVEDLLVRFYHQRRLQEQQNPTEAAVAEIIEEDQGEELEARGKKWLSRPEVQTTLQRLIRGGTEEELEVMKRPLTIRIASSRSHTKTGD